MASSTSGWGDPGQAGPAGTGYPAPAQAQRNGFGIAALVLGILAALFFWTIVGGLVLGLLAVVFGILGYRRKSRGEATNGGMALAGAILGGLALAVSAVVLVAGASILGSEEFGSYADCMQNAKSTAEQQQCQRDFSDAVNR
ncbi:DUF4190 domain-containing protein [Streptomyces meridianus]|uniref:DUF4190 domain-containing protein n=1 Tax=Streptomyces meridianus TaxID=2938945 RepID=A0ABT0X5D4_9ACTN|nr:DUF4190 domain-containing protein [Streptomyces meridianus]MCM2577634.1 DUF4190 domain-containing protein [Streptomyces meridianus]